MAKQEFIYGHCLTDWKDQQARSLLSDWWKAIRGKDLFVNYRSKINQSDEAFIRATLKKLQLPLPYASTVFSGNDQRLLFLDSHGIVIRIGRSGKTDPRHYLHPHILQPVGWINSEEHDLSLSLYKSAYHFDRSSDEASGKWDRTMKKVELSLLRASFCYTDLFILNNVGFIPLKDGTQFPVCIDISQRIAEIENHQKNAYDALREKGVPVHEALKVISNLEDYSFTSPENCKEAFDYHQPLRRAFSSAWFDADKNKGEPHPEKMKNFWRMARNYTLNGYTTIEKNDVGYSNISSVRRSPIPWKVKPA